MKKILPLFICAILLSGISSAQTVTNTNDSGSGSLRDAITNATSGATITIDPSLAGQTVTLTSGQITFSVDMTIVGADGFEVSGNNASRIFNISVARTVSISNMIMSNGNPGGSNSGGAINQTGTLTLTDCTLRGNVASNGGAIYNGFGTVLNLIRCTFSGNSTSGNSGGAIFNFGTLVATNCTFSGNTTTGLDQLGGAIIDFQHTTLNSCTFTANTATGSGGAIYTGGGTMMSNTIVSGNTAPNGPDIFGTIVSNGNNLIENTTGTTINGTGTGDVTGVSANLDPLAANGGLTETHALLSGSPAIDAGNSATAATLDQRGYGRSGTADIGAFEFNGTAPVSGPTVTTTAANTIGSSSATLGGVVTADGGNTVTERGIVYAVTSTDSDPEIGGTGVTQDTNGSGTGAFAESITGLTVGTSYSFKAYATNSDGTSYGAVETFMTTGSGLTWTGTTDTNWNDATNWTPNAVPLATDDVTIPNVATKPIINNTGAIVNNLTVDAASTITVNGGGSLIVSSTSTGNITYQRNLPATDKWYLVSSPVSGQTIEGLITNNSFATGSSSNIGLASYNNATNSWDYQTSGSMGSINNGQGYSVRLAASGDISFTGTLNTDDVTQAITIGAGSAFNLIGNPYPSYINSGTFLSSNTSKLTSETIWVWNQATDSYDTKVTANNFKVAPAQGFFVQCATVGDVIFDKTNQGHEGTDTFQRQTTPEIKLLVADESTSRYAEIYYFENATTGFDNGYDGELFGGVQNSFELYSHLLSGNLNKKYQIQSLPNSDYESMVIPVGLKADAGKEITFSAETMNLPTDIKVFLEDKEANIFTRLDEANTEYTVTLSETLNGIGRFYIHTTANALSVDDVALNTVSVYKSDANTLRIVGLPQGNTTVKIYNVLGKELMSSSFEVNGIKDISVSKLATGMYIAKIQTEVGTLNKKIILE